MRILIVDDLPRRYERLVSAFGAIGIDRQQIDFAICANEARDKLDEHAFDLLILDILLPLWPEGEEDVQNSADLLFEIREGELANPPRHILGITADPSVAGPVITQFEAWTWTVLHFAETNDDWVIRAVNCAKYLLDQQAVPPEPARDHVDLAIICALANPEQSEVLKLPWDWSAARPIDDQVFIRDGHVAVGARRLTVCVTAAPRMGMVATAIRSAAVIAKLRPRLVAMTGVCAGVRGKVRLGDVLFADPAWDFQSGKRVRDKENTQFSMRPHHLPASARVRSHVEQLRDDRAALGKVATDFPGDPSGVPRIFLGPVASGSAVLADGEVIKQIREQHQELVGVEMEIYGLFAAAQAASPQPQVFALKGVCDFADPDKDDGHQQFAAYASAQILRLLIERFGDRLIAN